MKKTIKIPLVLVILLALILVICIKSNASTTGIITEITVNVREKASIDSNIVMFVTQDDKVEILEKTGDWYKIKYNKKEGYVYSDFIKIDSDSKVTNNKEEQKKLESEDDEITKTITPKLLLPKDTGVRIAPNIMSNIIYTVTSDENIDILEKINSWSYIKLNNIQGWVINDQIKEVTTEIEEENKNEDTSSEKNKLAYVKYDNVNLRKEPSADSNILQKLKLNTQVSIIEEVDPVWSKVIVSGETGYISKDLLSEKKQEEKEEEKTNLTTTSREGEATDRIIQNADTVNKKNNVEKEDVKNDKEEVKVSSNKGEEIVKYAKKYLGYDYVYGGTSPKTGFDCSGFTFYIYKQFGYNLSRSSGGQANDGTKVSKDELKPGDLVIYKNTSLTAIGHVGIYIGDNKMIHASEPGVGVTITDIDSKAHKYPQRFVMGRRIIK